MQPDRNPHLTNPGRDTAVGPSPGASSLQRDAAAQIMREQIDRIYQQEGSTQPQTASPAPQATPIANTQAESWKHYHSAWQKYYQQYYERYYLNQLHSQRQKLANPGAKAMPDQAATPSVDEAPTNAPDPAVNDIRNQLIARVQQQSHKARHSKHFWPVVSALIVMLIFATLQFNRVVIANAKSFISPGSINPQNLIIDPTTSINVGNEPKLIIPKINVEVPIVYGVQSLEDGPVQQALKNGVVHYPIPGANSLPGQNGNAVFLGHSSNDVFDDGAYKFVFVQLERLQPGDVFYIHYEGIRYTYSISSKQVINPNEVSKLITDASKPTATLVTCVPLGTATHRLVVFADQISPDPIKAGTAPTESGSSAPVLPGNSPTLLDRLFGR